MIRNKDTNVCTLSPCLNGATCVPSTEGASYTCTCPTSSYSGTNCETCMFNFS